MKSKEYRAPATKVTAMGSHHLMIPISGQTTPEDADTKGAYYYDEERNTEKGTIINVWDL